MRIIGDHYHFIIGREFGRVQCVINGEINWYGDSVYSGMKSAGIVFWQVLSVVLRCTSKHFLILKAPHCVRFTLPSVNTTEMGKKSILYFSGLFKCVLKDTVLEIVSL